MAGNLTKRQSQILDFISDYIATRKQSPTLAEIGQAFGLSSLATIHKHVRNIAEKGLLTWKWNCARSIRPTHACPACGREFHDEDSTR